jgi:hypothetical protein
MEAMTAGVRLQKLRTKLSAVTSSFWRFPKAMLQVNRMKTPDEGMLQTIQNCFKAKDKNSMPLVVVALTQIDQLRPLREWHPPYDVMNPCGATAQDIRLMMDTVMRELGLTIE